MRQKYTGVWLRTTQNKFRYNKAIWWANLWQNEVATHHCKRRASHGLVQPNESVIKRERKDLIRGSVEETLNDLLEAEAAKLTLAA